MFRRNRRSAFTVPLGAVFISLGALLSAFSGCSTNPATGDNQLILISTEQEISMGREASPIFEEQFGGKVANPQAQAALESFGRRIAAESDRPMPYSFALLASDIPNAFALPGGPIYVTSGFMMMIESDRELAAVLGHEIGHISARHSVAAMSRQVGWQFLVNFGAALLGEEGGLAVLAGQFATGMAELSYSRENEYEADSLGLRYMVRAGYDPDGMAEMLGRLLALSNGGDSRLNELFRTHPNTQSRVDRVWNEIDRKYAGVPRPDEILLSRDFAIIRDAAIQTLAKN